MANSNTVWTFTFTTVNLRELAQKDKFLGFISRFYANCHLKTNLLIFFRDLILSNSLLSGKFGNMYPRGKFMIVQCNPVSNKPTVPNFLDDMYHTLHNNWAFGIFCLFYFSLFVSLLLLTNFFSYRSFCRITSIS